MMKIIIIDIIILVKGFNFILDVFLLISKENN